MDIEREAAERIIKALKGRKGFDYWWHGIEEETKQEIIKEIADILDTTPF